MACSHADSCPLHPHLNDSLAGWRDHYCDSAANWRECARFERSLSGQPVPLALLPNGKMVGGAAAIVADQPVAVEPSTATSAASTATAVLNDTETVAVLEKAKTAKPSFWNRFTNLFGGFK